MEVKNKRLRLIGIVFIVLSIIMAITIWLRIYNVDKNERVKIDNFDQAFNYIRSNSTIFSDTTMSLTRPYWPEENFIINLKSKQIVYCYGKDTLFIPYSDVTGKTHIKKFSVTQEDNQNELSKSLFSAIDSCQSIPIDPAYELKIKNENDLEEQNKKLSRIYNILAGNQGGHIILGRDSRGIWKCFQPTDFPSLYINEEKLREFVQFHLDNPEFSPVECYQNRPFITQETELHVVYYDFRRDTLIEKNGHMTYIPPKPDPTKPIKTEHSLDTVKLSKGWVNYKVTNDKTTNWPLESAYDYYMGYSRKFISQISQEEVEIALSQSKWSIKEDIPTWLIDVLDVATILFFLIGLICTLLCVDWKKMKVNTSKQEENPEKIKVGKETKSTGKEISATDDIIKNMQISGGQPETTVSADTDKSDLCQSQQKRIEELEKQVANLKKKEYIQSIIDEYKQKHDIDTKLEYAKRWESFVSITSQKDVFNELINIHKNQKDFPVLFDYDEVIRKATSSSKNGKEQLQYFLHEICGKINWEDGFKELCKLAQKWQQFADIKKASVLYEELEEIQKKYDKFPSIDTPISIYSEAIKSSKDYREQIAYILHKIITLSNGKVVLENHFKDMCTNEDYANAVKDKFEIIKSYAEKIEKQSQIKTVLSKENHNYLDRMAISIWAINGFNTLMSTFTSNSLSQNAEKSIQDALISDLLQLFTTRVFVSNCKNGQPLSVFKEERQKKMNELLSRLYSDYSMQYKVDSSYVSTVESLDNAYDQIRSTDEYVTRMYDTFVKEFSEKADSNEEKAWFFGMMVAMGYHTVDFVRRKKNISINLCPNYAYLLTDFDNSRLPEESYFKYKDYAHSVEYSNRIYEWLDEMGVQHLKALVGRQLIKP